MRGPSPHETKAGLWGGPTGGALTAYLRAEPAPPAPRTSPCRSPLGAVLQRRCNAHQCRPQQGRPQQGQPHRCQPPRGQAHRCQPQRGQPMDCPPQRCRPQQGRPQQGQPHRGQPHRCQPPRRRPHRVQAPRCQAHRCRPAKRGADLRGAVLQGADLGGVKHDRQTRWLLRTDPTPKPWPRRQHPMVRTIPIVGRRPHRPYFSASTSACQMVRSRLSPNSAIKRV